MVRKRKKKTIRRRKYKSRHVRKRTFGHMRPAKIQIILHIDAVGSKSSLCVFGIAKDAKFLHADVKDSDQTAHMPKDSILYCRKERMLKISKYNVL